MDDPSLIVKMIVFVICIMFSSLFSSIETAFMSVNKIRIRTLSEDGNKKAKKADNLLNDTDRFLSTVLVGNNLVNIAGTSLSTEIALSIFGSVGVAYATGFVTLVVLIFGEITPKSLATKNAEKLCLNVAGFMTFCQTLFAPVVFVLSRLAKFLVKILGGDGDNGPTMTEDVIKNMVDVSHEEGVLEEEEKEMIHNVFEFGDTEIKEIMTPRIHVVGISEDVTYDELMRIVKKEQFSRIPIYNETHDEVVGILNIKDLFFETINEEDFNVRNYMRPSYFVYEFNNVSDVFTWMKKDHSPLAIVVDEYGVMSGIVTLEDIIEEIVGEIDDEYDVVEVLIKKQDDNTYLVDGSVDIDQVNDELNVEIESDEFESIGGLVLGLCGSSRPRLHQEVQYENLRMTIEKIQKNRIATLKIVVLEKEELEEKHD